ncbi:tyrosinase [Histoplasma capsulatum var. duboisii H88]|uniref:Tyrosinase n=3 Tax=Ajellomyces capsulatus TaxID=5037 RepID=F0UB83_AJEC8|nr:tyrosinase [Histoplasma capsulatum var. duboisii H88]
MRQHFLASLISFWSIMIIGTLGGSDEWGKNRQDLIDTGACLLQLQTNASHQLYEALRGRRDTRQDEKARACNNGHDCDDYRIDDRGKKNHRLCTPSTLTIRKEWRFLSKAERRKYIEAVYCLQSKPSLFTEEEAPGSKNLFDSFAVVHITKTPFIHGNFNFLAWHRYFVWAYEKALREECGYHGISPYWEWGYDVYDPQKSALFDGSPYSFGSNGAPLAERDPTYRLPPPPPFPKVEGREFPAGTGGGCVMFGPFSDMTTNLGPVGMPGGDLTNPLRYNPRCLVRDMNPFIGQHYTSFNWSTWTIEESRDIDEFQSRLAGAPGNEDQKDFPLNFFGVHGGGHAFLGGMTGQHSDLYSSPQEPAFFLHHGQIDRLWSIWQWLDIEKRRNAIYGTLTLANIPPTRNGTLDDIIDVGPLAPPVPVREVMSTIDGPFCYFYQ